MDRTQSEVKKRAKKIAQLIIRQGKTPAEAMKAAGYSAKQAKKGFPTMMRRKALRNAYSKELERFADRMGDLPSAEERAHLARLRLTTNIVRGEDKAVASIKLAGMDREVRMFEPDNQNQILITMPLVLEEK